VLFDLDGTLADTIGLIVASHEYAFDAVLGRQLPRETYLSWIGLPLTECYVEEFPQQSRELEARYLEFNEANAEAMTKPFPGVKALLKDLRAAGARAGVATSKRRAASETSLRVVGIDGLVELAATAESTRFHKPRPEPLLAAARWLGADPSEMVYVGDSVFDAQAARAAAMDCLLVTYGAGEADELAAERPLALLDDAAGLRAALLGADLPGDAPQTRGFESGVEEGLPQAARADRRERAEAGAGE
jgi:pyrophosphatase PpaX